ncbi:hypothetical protein ZEAMMB73_Zm00001d052207 [Zea mays]|uniref:Uncharacterized protein n=1 Tax=Zea mays TaxID=4577 RepID=K7U5U4_MAIZE|nr:hypothetical protein ZEAMMB73_Zm00001d052207 [Zea mays]
MSTSSEDISVQVIFPGSQYQTNEQEQPKHVSSAVDSTNPVGLASSAAPLSVCVHYLFFGFLLLFSRFHSQMLLHFFTDCDCDCLSISVLRDFQ